ncbi:MAG: alpha/beta hydrolase [Chloroflexales bacterium]|nr:alpha/beta hydrolase [Chloroflexales bacterium]
MPLDVIRRNNVQVSGAGTQPLIFAHGFGCAQTIWRFVAPAFAHDYRVVLFDYVGAGLSDHHAFSAERYADLSGYARDVLEICAALDLERSIFVGHSISGMIGLLASIQAPERFERMIMISPSARYVNDPPDYIGGFERADIVGLLDLMEKNYAGWASYLAPLVMRNAERPDLARELEASIRATDPQIAQHFAATTFFIDHRADLPAATVPSLILQCADDMIVPPEAADYLHRHLPASMQWMMQATGHYPHVSHAEETIRLIRKYLAQPLLQA